MEDSKTQTNVRRERFRSSRKLSLLLLLILFNPSNFHLIKSLPPLSFSPSLI
jgi:hypothetical protein